MSATITNRHAFLGIVGVLVILGLLGPSVAGAAVWYADASVSASDANPGTAQQPVQSVAKAVSLAQARRHGGLCGGNLPLLRGEGARGPRRILPITLRADGKGKVIFNDDGTRTILRVGVLQHHRRSRVPHELRASQGRRDQRGPQGTRDHPQLPLLRLPGGSERRERALSDHPQLRNGLSVGLTGSISHGSGGDVEGHWDPADECRNVEVRNCYLHDAGWNVKGTEGYGVTANGAVEYLVIENCQIDNNSGDGILYEDWAVHTTARYNVIRGTGIAAIWIDNASMSIFDNNYLEANNVAVWLSGEESSNRYLSDFVAIRNNIIVHNDWSALDPSVYGKAIFLITSSTRDTYFDNNTVAFNKCDQVDPRREPPAAERLPQHLVPQQHLLGEHRPGRRRMPALNCQGVPLPEQPVGQAVPGRRPGQDRRPAVR